MRRHAIRCFHIHVLCLGLLASSLGCSDDPLEAGPPTFYQDVAPIVAEHCGSCHSADGIAPFALDTYANTSTLGETMLAAVESGLMPPWLARETDECSPVHDYKNDLRLAPEKIDILRQWVAAGKLEGDASNPAPLPEPPKLSLTNPNATPQFVAPYTVAGTADEFQCFVLDPGHTERVWITGSQLIADNSKVGSPRLGLP